MQDCMRAAWDHTHLVQVPAACKPPKLDLDHSGLACAIKLNKVLRACADQLHPQVACLSVTVQGSSLADSMA